MNVSVKFPLRPKNKPLKMERIIEFISQNKHSVPKAV